MCLSVKMEQHYISQAMEDLNKQRQEDQLCDVILVVNGKKFPAHRCVLAACSSYFKTMFTIEMKEIYERDVKLTNMDATDVEHLLHFMYTGRINIRKENYYRLLQVASLTQTKGLLAEVNDFMETILNPTNCFDLLAISYSYLLSSLKERVDLYVLKNFAQVSKNYKFLKLPESDVFKILKSDELRVESEEIVYEALVRWIKHDAVNRKDNFPVLFDHVRLQYISPRYLSEVVRREALVRSFPECRDMVDDAFDFQLRPTAYERKRERLSSALVADSLVYFGTNFSEEIGIFNEIKRTWSRSKADEKFISEGCAFASDGSRIFFCGGKAFSSQMERTVICFNGQTWCHDIPDMLSFRYNACAVVVQENLYVFGGEKYDSQGCLRNYTDAKSTSPGFAERLNLQTKRWSIVQNTYSEELRSCTAVVVGEKVFLLGGKQTRTKDTSTSKSRKLPKRGMSASTPNVLIFNTKDSSLNDGNNMNSPRADFGAAVSNNKIFVFGGLSDPQSVSNSNVEFMDCSSSVWTYLTTKPPINSLISNLGAASSSACCVAGVIAVVYSNNSYVFLYDPLTDTWESEELQASFVKNIVESIGKERLQDSNEREMMLYQPTRGRRKSLPCQKIVPIISVS